MDSQIVIYSLFIVLILVSIVTLVIVSRLYVMHDVKNSDGQYAWMISDEWAIIQKNMIKTQELMLTSIAELSVQNGQISKLLETQTNATLSMFEELKRFKVDCR